MGMRNTLLTRRVGLLSHSSTRRWKTMQCFVCQKMVEAENSSSFRGEGCQEKNVCQAYACLKNMNVVKYNFTTVFV